MFKSKFEDEVNKYFDNLKYETDILEYIHPAEIKKYLPDFKLDQDIYLETKGKFTRDDRKKHLLIREQYPHIKIILLFQNSRQRLSKSSSTTYGEWCDKHKLIWYCWRTKRPPKTIKELIEDANRQSSSYAQRKDPIQRRNYTRRTRFLD